MHTFRVIRHVQPTPFAPGSVASTNAPSSRSFPGRSYTSIACTRATNICITLISMGFYFACIDRLSILHFIASRGVGLYICIASVTCVAGNMTLFCHLLFKIYITMFSGFFSVRWCPFWMCLLCGVGLLNFYSMILTCLYYIV